MLRAAARTSPLLLVAVAWSGCMLDRSPLLVGRGGGSPLVDASLPTDASAPRDASPAPDASDASPLVDAGCAPGSTRCVGAQRERCEDGTWRDAPCPLGCVGESGARCIGFAPSNVGEPALTETASSTATLEGSLSTGDCEGGEVREQGPGAPELCVRRFDGPLRVGPLEVTGPRPLALVAGGAVEVVGEVRLVGGTAAPGPGGGVGGAGDMPAGGQSPGGNGRAGSGRRDGGGGGGGSCGGGGRGGDAQTSGLRGAAGGHYAEDYLLEPLRGGSGGGRGSSRGSGGGGGGALQISALGPITIASTVVVGGGAGGGGPGGGDAAAGAGGGGGGGLLLESPVGVRYVEGAQVWASGGGGGGGASLDNSGGNGQRGDREAPAGGGSGGFYGASGGRGGVGPGLAQDGGTLDRESNGGGGGGGAGCVVVRAPDASPPPGTGVFRSAPPRLVE